MMTTERHGLDERRRLTEPLGIVTRIFGVFLLVIMAALVVTTLVGSGSIGGFGHAVVCATQPRTGYGGADWAAHLGVAARPGAYLAVNGTLQACAPHPSVAQRVLYTLTSLPAAALWAGILLALWLLVRAAERTGPFTLPVAAAMRRLGWLVIVGSAVVASAQGAALDALLNTMLRAQNDFADAIPMPRDLLPVPLLAGAALLTLARVIRRGAAMDDEIKGTV